MLVLILMCKHETLKKCGFWSLAPWIRKNHPSIETISEHSVDQIFHQIWFHICIYNLWKIPQSMSMFFSQLESTITAVEKQSTTEGPLRKAICSVRQFPQPHDSPVILLMATRNPASTSWAWYLIPLFTTSLWFHIFFYFHPYLERWSNLTYTLKGLVQPPIFTRFFIDLRWFSRWILAIPQATQHWLGRDLHTPSWQLNQLGVPIFGARMCTREHLKGTLRYLLGWALRRSWY